MTRTTAALPIPAKHLPAVVSALRANNHSNSADVAFLGDGVAYLNVGSVTYTNENRASGVSLSCVPPEWRALADATCETCYGSGLTAPPPEFWKPQRPHRPCRGTGKPIRTLTVELLDPHAYTELSARARLERRRSHGEELIAREVDGQWYTGRVVSVDVVVAELVPVIRAKDADGLTQTVVSVIQANDGFDLPIMQWPRGTHPITPLGPPLTPGDWVAVLRTVD